MLEIMEMGFGKVGFWMRAARVATSDGGSLARISAETSFGWRKKSVPLRLSFEDIKDWMSATAESSETVLLNTFKTQSTAVASDLGSSSCCNQAMA